MNREVHVRICEGLGVRFPRSTRPLGFPVEGRPPETCRPYIDEVLRDGRIPAWARPGLRFGQYTDDSQLARELLQSYQGCRGFSPEDYARRIAAIFAEKRICGCGRATLEAAQRLIRGVPWRDAGARPPAAGNGTAMRAGPVGLLCFDDPEALARVAHEQGFITHQDPRCSAGSVAIAGAVALALRPGPLAPGDFTSELASWCRRHDESVAGAVARLPEWLPLPPEEAVRAIATVDVDPAQGPPWPGISPFVTTSVLWSLYAFLRTPDDYRATIHTAIAVGGDVDTTAAMAGAISGARLGIEALPEELLARVHDQDTWGLDDLVDLAEGCYEIKCGGKKRPGLLRRLLGGA